MNIEEPQRQITENETINIRAELEKYLIHWKWFLLGTLFCLLGAFLYLRYSTPKYSASTTILIKDEKKGGLSEEIAGFGDLGIVGSNRNIDNEIEILKSRKLISEVVDRLNLNIILKTEGKIKSSEVYYKNSPVRIAFLSDSVKSANTFFKINIIDDKSFELINANKENIGRKKFGEPIQNNQLGQFIISFDKKETNYNSLFVYILPKEQIVSLYQSAITISKANKASSVLKLSLQHPLKEKAKDILNELTDTYNKESIEDKNKVSLKTKEFISERLDSIGSELASVNDKVLNFRKRNNVTDIKSEALLFLETNASNRQKFVEANNELNLIKSLKNEFKNSKDDYLPSNLGFNDPNIGKSIAEYNELISRKNKKLVSAGEKNPIIIEINDNIAKLKQSLKRSLQNQENSIAITVKNLRREAAISKSKLSSIPQKERDFLDIASQQEIISGLYSYLLKKKEETSISLAANTVPNAKIIDRAHSSELPVSPKKKIIYLAALLLGLIIPFGWIYIKNLLDTKVHTKKDIDELTSIPFIGYIPHYEEDKKITISSDARSSTAEAFRLVRTNLDFMLSNVNEEKGKTIFITSTISGEGKSFISINLAASLALSGKKVILVGMDLRAPKITEYLEIPDRIGITNYITDNDLTVNELKFQIPQIKNLDIIASGVIPPNPAELLMTDRVHEIFNILRKDYDYVLVDTAPVSLVTDTLLISKHADISLYTIRANHLDKRLLTIPQNLYNEKRLSNMAIILNDTDIKREYGYGRYGGYGGYGYGVSENKKPWYKKLFNIS